MTTSITNCILIGIGALLAAIAAFLLSLFNVFNFNLLPNLFLWLLLVTAFLYAIFFATVMLAEKNRLIREAICTCGKTALIGFIGTLMFAIFTLLLFNGTIKILFDLALAFTIFFYVLLVAGIACILTTLYQCRRTDC